MAIADLTPIVQPWARLLALRSRKARDASTGPVARRIQAVLSIKEAVAGTSKVLYHLRPLANSGNRSVARFADDEVRRPIAVEVSGSNACGAFFSTTLRSHEVEGIVSLVLGP